MPLLRRPSEGGFTILEVMVAVAILAISLTAIFSSEAGSIKVAHRARRTTVASLLARCKMGEIEEQVAKEGLPAIDDAGSDECCEDGEIDGFSCDWKIKRVVLPDQLDVDEEGEEGGGALGGLLGGSEEGDDEGASGGSPLAGLTGGGGAMPDGVDDMLAGPGGPQDALAEMAFGLAFPILKPSIEEQVRRAEVTVKWLEGDAEKSFDVVQYLVAPAPPQGSVPPGGIPGQPGTPGSGQAGGGGQRGGVRGGT
jgi:general secretion pathway protein I